MHNQERSVQTALPSCWLSTAKRPNSCRQQTAQTFIFIKNKRQPSRVFRDPILSRPDRIGSLVKSASFFSLIPMSLMTCQPRDAIPHQTGVNPPKGGAAHQAVTATASIIVRPVDRCRTCVSDLERTGALVCLETSQSSAVVPVANGASSLDEVRTGREAGAERVGWRSLKAMRRQARESQRIFESE